jgi:hypothetical protein
MAALFASIGAGVSAGASVADGGSFVGTWDVSGGYLGFTITSEGGGSCRGHTAAASYLLEDCHVSGGSYSFTVVLSGSSYVSHNTGTIDGSTLTGEFHDTNGTDVDYTATRVGGFVLSGRVTAVSCDEDASTCSAPPTPVADVTVTATGDSTGSATTDTEGDYSINLPAGSYTVTPSADNKTFDPDSRSVDLNSDVSGVDFTTCADDTTNTTMQRANLAGAEDAPTTPARSPSPTTYTGTFGDQAFTVKITCAGTASTLSVEWRGSLADATGGFKSSSVVLSGSKKYKKPQELPTGVEINIDVKGTPDSASGSVWITVTGTDPRTVVLDKAQAFSYVANKQYSAAITPKPGDLTPASK